MKGRTRILYISLTILALWVVYGQLGARYRLRDAVALRFFDRKGVTCRIETIHINGSSLHYASTGSDTLPTLLFMHGSPGSWSKFRRYMQDPDLLKKFRMVSVDRPGFGFSDYGKARSLQEQSNLIRVLLKKIENGKPVYGVGRSYGGPMIAKLAVENPGYFSGLVFLAAALDPHAEKAEKWRNPFQTSLLKYLVPGAWRTSNEELWNLKEELFPLSQRLREINCNVVIMHGDQDHLVPVRNAYYIQQKAVLARSVSLIIIPGANHFFPDHRYERVKQTLLQLY